LALAASLCRRRLLLLSIRKEMSVRRCGDVPACELDRVREYHTVGVFRTFYSYIHDNIAGYARDKTSKATTSTPGSTSARLATRGARICRPRYVTIVLRSDGIRGLCRRTVHVPRLGRMSQQLSENTDVNTIQVVLGTTFRIPDNRRTS